MVFFFVNLIIFGVNLINFYFQFPGVFSHAHTHRNILRTVFKLMKGCGITTMGAQVGNQGGRFDVDTPISEFPLFFIRPVTPGKDTRIVEARILE